MTGAIVVTGATGNVGREVVRCLAAAGQPVRAAVLEGDEGRDVFVFEADLEFHPDNGWALFGLAEALAAAGDHAAADEARERFEAAWQHAEVDLRVGDAGIMVVTVAVD